MEPIIFQEILLAHASRFFQKEFQQRYFLTAHRNLTSKEQLAEACWNGLLREILPELCTTLEMNQINEGNKFLSVCLGYDDERNNTCFSLNPYFFLNTTRKN
ncbi:MAG: hypothetical protein J0H55_02420 [Chitinophagaceae bacterium]|nr:hypothetical protein [Chitinophagaceae bacterium]